MSDRKPLPDSSLLLTLEEVSGLVSHSHDSGETLGNIVRLIQGRFHTDVCSVYLLESDCGELVLAATVGLKPESVGRVRMRLAEGLTGLTAQQMKPVMVDDAFQHPRFKFFPEAGEDPYHSFLGVPLVEGGLLHGVLVVQTAEPRPFSPSEVRMLVTVASQIAPLVSEAHLLDQIVAAAHAASAPGSETAQCAPQQCLRGSPLSPGVGLGEAYIINGFEEWLQTVQAHSASPDDEQQRLLAAMEAAREEVARVTQRVSALVGEEHGAILQAQSLILQDRKIEQDLMELVTQGATADAALIRTLERYVAAFDRLTSPYFHDRVYDLKDVFRRILWHIREHEGKVDVRAPGKLVLVARDVSVMDLFSVDVGDLAGVVAEHGGPQSHAAILARSLGIPMVGQVAGLVDHIAPGRQLLVDGSSGVVQVDPAIEAIARVGAGGQSADPRDPAVAATPPSFAGLPRIDVNINLLSEVGPAIERGAAGVGLYRTEFLFLARRTLPTEEEQVGTYRKLLSMLGGKPVNIRTVDLRPDKVIQHSHWSRGPLDWRLLLDSPAVQQLFREQVRAIHRAATAGPARMLIPLVTHSEQLDFVLQTVAQAREELKSEGLAFDPSVAVGIMLEVSAAAAMLESWIQQVDFCAIGTNDLVASAIGFDRDDPVLASLSDPLHPGVLRTIDDIVRVAHGAGRAVSVCGEMASDPIGAAALALLGVDSLSVAVHQLVPLRQQLANRLPESSNTLRSELLSQRTANDVRELLRAQRKPSCVATPT